MESVDYEFEEKVKSMKASEIIMAMVRGLQKRHVKIDMHTYGEVREERGFLGFYKKEVCYGCAATNAICEISGVKLNTAIKMNARSLSVGSSTRFLDMFESAINALRKGKISCYNSYANGDFAEIPEELVRLENSLPYLHNDYTKEDLQRYITLAEMVKSVEDKVEIAQ